MKETIAFYDFVNILDQYGWAYHCFTDITAKNGRTGTRYNISKYAINHPSRPFEELAEALKKAANDPDSIILSETHYRVAPEIKHHTITILD